MPFVPFDGVLLDDPREPIPGALALLLHLNVERELAAAFRRAPLGREAVQGRARACQELLAQGLLPDQLRGLDLPLGRPEEPGSLGSLVAHLEAYLAAVEASGHLEPMAALGRAALAQEAGGRGFWVEHTREDGPLDASLEDLAPARLRALLALEGVPVRFRLATRRGSGARGLFEGREPHLVAQVLPALEGLAASLDRFSLEAPEGWADNLWGDALENLFQGPLDLDPVARQALRRGLLPNASAVLRAAVEQIAAWVSAGLPASDITVFHPEAERIAPFLDGLLQAEGLGLHRAPARPLTASRDWAPLLALLEGMALGHPALVASALASSGAAEPLGAACRAFAAALERSDEAGPEAVAAALAGLDAPSRATLGGRWNRVFDLPRQPRSLAAWLAEVEAIALGFGLLGDGSDFHPSLGLLGQAWSGVRRPVAFGEMLEALRTFLEAGTTAPEAREEGGVRLLYPDALMRAWRGSRATLLLDLGEGAWPAAPALPPDLDEARRALLNAALRRAPHRGGFPPALQAFRLSRAEAEEALPRAFHVQAFAFNAALALTRQELVALSSETDAEGRRRGQGPFWQALAGAGAWTPSAARCASHLRHRWQAGVASSLERERQASLRLEDPETLPALRIEAPQPDRVPGWWREGLEADHPVSPTVLEDLARCPYRVFAARGLKLDPWAPGPSAPLGLGVAVHGLLQALLEGLGDAPHWPEAFLERHGLPRPEAPALEILLTACWRARGAGFLDPLRLGETESGVVARGVEALLPDLAAVLAWDLAQTGPLAEERTAFGLTGAGPWRRRLEGLEARVGPVALLDPPRWFQGRVDRLERWSCGGEAFRRILDYKTSRPESLKAYGEADGFTAAHLQLPLYQQMLETRDGLPVSAWLLPLRDFSKPVPAFFEPGDGESRGRLEAHVTALLDRAEAGIFPAVPGEACASCGLAALCGRPVDLDAAEPETEEAGA
ncbi:MAG: PD-(D/E)XK nuclease family protein [Holophagaceae bacterium]